MILFGSLAHLERLALGWAILGEEGCPDYGVDIAVALVFVAWCLLGFGREKRERLVGIQEQGYTPALLRGLFPDLLWGREEYSRSLALVCLMGWGLSVGVWESCTNTHVGMSVMQFVDGF
jgi:hypothetical protein